MQPEKAGHLRRRCLTNGDWQADVQLLVLVRLRNGPINYLPARTVRFFRLCTLTLPGKRWEFFMAQRFTNEHALFSGKTRSA